MLQDVAKSTSACSRRFGIQQKVYTVVEGSPKRHIQYMKAIEMLNMSDGLLALQSLSGTRWPTRSVKLRIVSRCLPAMVDFQDQLTDADSIRLLSANFYRNCFFSSTLLQKPCREWTKALLLHQRLWKT